MLTLDLNRIRTAQERFERVYRPDQLTKESDFSIVDPVSLAFDIFNPGAGAPGVGKAKEQFRLVGDVKTVLELPCSRCLEPFQHGVDSHFDLRYQPHAANTGEAEREIEEDDLSTAFYENEQIDLGQLMREQFYLAVPMKPLCSDACRGLCPVCGANLNREKCGCTREWDDPRFAALNKLKAES